MRSRTTSNALAVTMLAMFAACGSSAVTNPGDGGLQPCQDDQDCNRGFTCTGGYCVATIPPDAGPDAAAVPKMMVSPTLLDFGNVFSGTDYTKTFGIANVGGATLTITAMNLVDPEAAFTVQSKPVPFTIDPGVTETITVVLRLQSATLPTGSIKIHSDDPDPTSGSATVDLVSRSKGSPDLSVCSNNPTPPPDCQTSTDGNPVIDFGVVPYGSSAQRLVDVRNVGDGNLPIQITEVSLSDPNHFTLNLFQLIDDGSGNLLEQQLTLPFYLSSGDPTATPPVAPTVIRAHVGFSAVGIDGDVPHIQLVIKYALPESPTSVPVVGTIAGCIPVATDAGMPDGGADPMTDPNNCGTCGHVCVVQHGTPGCVNGQCTVASCDQGWSDCDNNPATGCERDLNNDPDACGACGKQCSGNNMQTRTCANGTCNGTCATGFKDCNGNKLTDGCESESAADPNNCSDCGVQCSTNHMDTRTCNAGICNGTCGAGYDDCDGNKQTNGCEADLSNAATCGSCGNNCSTQLTGHAATAGCASGSCTVATCQAGYYDMNGSFGDGCECTATDAVPNSCPGTAYAAPVTLTGNNLMPAGDVDWYKFTFTTDGTCIHPSIAITSGDPVIKMDVYTDCSSGASTCTGGGETPVAVRTWDHPYSNCFDQSPTVDPSPDQGTFWQLPLVYYVKVYASGSASNCLSYTLTATQ